MSPETDIKKIVSDLLNLCDFRDFGVDVVKDGENYQVKINLLNDAGLIIGQDGENISCWERIMTSMAQKIVKGTRISLDVNNYRWSKDQLLRDLAQKIAKEVRRTGKETVLRPMNAYERRVVHTELALHPDLTTESIGEEPERRVVVKVMPV